LLQLFFRNRSVHIHRTRTVYCGFSSPSHLWRLHADSHETCQVDFPVDETTHASKSRDEIHKQCDVCAQVLGQRVRFYLNLLL
jgi:hypothetical protein